jgi:uncharacterized integral membrane protein
MIRAIRYAILGAIALSLVVMALANREPVTLRALPDNMAAFAGGNLTVSLPLYAVIFAAIIAGLLLGFVWEWLREYKHRATATAKARDVARLERELAVMRDTKTQPKDDVLALLETPRKAG